MNRIQYRRLRAILSLLVIVALLGSQSVLAQHAVCQGPPPSAPSPAHAESADCAPESARDAALCESHCSQGELSHDTTRAPGVPMLGPVSFVRVTLLVSLPEHGASTSPAPPRSWHRPTPHPASVLLI